MLPMQPEKEHPMTGSLSATPLRTGHCTNRLRWPRPAQSALPFVLLLTVLAACAPGEAPPAAICDTYDRALFTTQLMGGAAVLLGLAVLGFRKNLTAILPSQGAQIGAVAGSVGLGLILLAFSTDIGNQILTGFAIESLYTLCGLG
ncbi:MAG: hypothetical protein IPM39_27960 [Chloroflexi bacterium]|nr:hypothetical protein [Chloroflexota bacterium]